MVNDSNQILAYNKEKLRYFTVRFACNYLDHTCRIYHINSIRDKHKIEVYAVSRGYVAIALLDAIAGYRDNLEWRYPAR